MNEFIHLRMPPKRKFNH